MERVHRNTTFLWLDQTPVGRVIARFSKDIGGELLSDLCGLIDWLTVLLELDLDNSFSSSLGGFVELSVLMIVKLGGIW